MQLIIQRYARQVQTSPSQYLEHVPVCIFAKLFVAQENKFKRCIPINKKI